MAEMKEIAVSLTDDEWKQLLDTIRREFRGTLSDNEIEEIVKKDIVKFIRDTYIHGLVA
ncbi:MAG: hypothetical protein ACE5IF_00125 [Candidatus Bathyarchaeia archaeon]